MTRVEVELLAAGWTLEHDALTQGYRATSRDGQLVVAGRTPAEVQARAAAVDDLRRVRAVGYTCPAIDELRGLVADLPPEVRDEARRVLEVLRADNAALREQANAFRAEAAAARPVVDAVAEGRTPSVPAALRAQVIRAQFVRR